MAEANAGPAADAGSEESAANARKTGSSGRGQTRAGGSRRAAGARSGAARARIRTAAAGSIPFATAIGKSKASPPTSNESPQRVMTHFGADADAIDRDR